MMIDRRLIAAVPGTKGYIAGSVALQWVSLASNIGMVAAFCWLISRLYAGTARPGEIAVVVAACAACALVRLACSRGVALMAYRSSRLVKSTLRTAIYEKLLRLGAGYRDVAATSEVVQVAVEGVEQLETYFASYLPQLFYALLAPLTLFAALAGVSLPAAVVLLVCVPLIPVAIAAVQTWAKKLLSRYWGQYTQLGDTFLENLQGLVMLKVYGADEFKQRQMSEQAEQFRRITMRVLIMQLNSIAIMDLVAFGGAAAGVAVAVLQLRAGAVGMAGALAIILLSADFFIPMRQLGSFFHIAMNGMAASEKIFRLLDAPEPSDGAMGFPAEHAIRARGLGFAYADRPERSVLSDIDLDIAPCSLVALVGESGCGKSTLAGLLSGRNRGYAGSLSIGGVEVSDIRERALLDGVTYVGHQAYLFGGSVRDNLAMAAPRATDAQMWEALAATRLDGFVRTAGGLDMPLAERASNLSGGQRQRLAIARALLHDSPVYVFDEAASNIDVESEDAIMEAVRALAGRKTVLLITHRLASAVDADQIVVMDAGRVVERGRHAELLAAGGAYANLFNAQHELEVLGVDQGE